MSEWKLLIVDGLDEEGQAILRAQTEVEDSTGIAAANLLYVIGIYDALVVRSRTKVTAERLDAAGRAD